MTESKVAPLTTDQLSELLRLTKDADSVELKLTVPDSDHRSTAIALDVDPLEAEIRQVVFFDTPDLQLNQRGVVVRARRVQGKGDDSVVKLRPVVPYQRPSKLRKSPDFGVEVDALPGGFVCSASFKADLDRPRVRDVIARRKPISKAFNQGQRDFYKDHAPEGLELDDLSVLGPVLVLKLKFEPADFGRKLVAEMWLYPDGSRILELSTKCLPNETFQVAAEAKAFLAGRGVDLTAEQQTKTRTALEFFTSHPVVTTDTAGP
ncbi:MAG TPA: adenylate cyclase [Acidimicrobiia bacterium]|nr:adenylate cyclase [Acidimicrobiia bacterium]